MVERLTGSTKPGPWRSDEAVRPGGIGHGRLWRVSGDRWSVVLKLVHHSHDGHPNWLSSADPDHWYYWKREVLAYRSACPHPSPADCGGPSAWASSNAPTAPWRCGWKMPAGESRGRRGTSSPTSRRRAVSAMPRAAVALEQPLRSEPWFTRDWLRSYLSRTRRGHGAADRRRRLDAPLVEDNLSRALAEPLRRMRHDQDCFSTPWTACRGPSATSTSIRPTSSPWARRRCSSTGPSSASVPWPRTPPSRRRLRPRLPRRAAAVRRALRRRPARLSRRCCAGPGGRVPAELVDLGMSATLAARYAWIGPALLASRRRGASGHEQAAHSTRRSGAGP